MVGEKHVLTERLRLIEVETVPKMEYQLRSADHDNEIHLQEKVNTCLKLHV